MQESTLHQTLHTCAYSQCYTKEQVFWLAQQMMCFMMLHKFPPFVILNASTDGLLICQLIRRYVIISFRITTN